MGTFLQKTQAGSSNSSKNSVSSSLSPYRHQLSRFHDLDTRFKGGWRLPFYAMIYRSNADSKQLNFLPVSSLNHESKQYIALLPQGHFHDQWHIMVISPYHAKLLSQALTRVQENQHHLSVLDKETKEEIVRWLEPPTEYFWCRFVLDLTI